MNSSEDNREFEKGDQLIAFLETWLVAITFHIVKQIKGNLEKLKF